MKAKIRPLPSNRSDRRLWIAISASLAFHGLLLSLHFAFPEASRVAREKALDIILVNARSQRSPADAQALAQANLDGGGNTDANLRAKTPLPSTEQQAVGEDLQQMRRRVRELEAAQKKMLSHAANMARVAAAETRSAQPEPVPQMTGADLAETARAMARLEGEIAKSIEEYNKRPQKKFIGARTKEYRLAPYFDAWKQKIERIGTLNYPEAARGKVYGKVVIFVELRVEDGSLYSVEISRSSGHKLLDDAALRILRMAAPFGPIPREAMDGATVLSFAREWNFVPGDTLATRNSNN